MTKPEGSGSIGVKPATNVFHAMRFASETGRKPNLLITINFSRLGIDDVAAGPLFSTLRKRAQRAWRYQRDQKGRQLGEFNDAGAHENPDGRRHVHWLVRIPWRARPWFEGVLKKLLRKLIREDDLGAAFVTTPIRALGGMTKYILKGLSPDWGSYFWTDTSDQGTIRCRRSFASRTLGYAARRRAGWVRKKRPDGNAGGRRDGPTHERKIIRQPSNSRKNDFEAARVGLRQPVIVDPVQVAPAPQERLLSSPPAKSTEPKHNYAQHLRWQNRCRLTELK